MKADLTAYYEFIQNEEINDNLNVIDFWYSNVSRWRHLSELALLVLTIPVGSAQVERTFNYHKLILSNLRRILSAQNLKATKIITCNKNI